jgi:glycosyltransferase involved in cell wall biosynthesis
MPNVILEGMASNLSVIASNVGAIEYLVSDDTGWLIEPNDKSQLYNSMVDAINCPESVLQKKRRNARKLVEEEFVWKKVITKTINKLSSSLPS